MGDLLPPLKADSMKDKFNSIEEILKCLEKTIDGADLVPTTTMVCDNFVMEPTTANAIHELKVFLRDLSPEAATSTDRAPAKSLLTLFEGDAHRAKTLTASLLANQSGFRLQKVNLSEIASEFPGETAKNLAEVLGNATGADVIFYFDEADALFGKRTDVKDSHDKYANIDTAYLLSLIEKKPGLKIFSTTAKSNLDEAFLRRLRTSISFPTK